MGYVIEVNGEKVWESEGDAMLVDRISVSTSRGEIASIGSANDNDLLQINVNVRDGVLTSDLDIVEARKAQERRDLAEQADAEISKSKAKTEPKKDTKSKKVEEIPVADLSEF